MCVYIYLSIYLSISLSLSIYIYIYIYTRILLCRDLARVGACAGPLPAVARVHVEYT